MYTIRKKESILNKYLIMNQNLINMEKNLSCNSEYIYLVNIILNFLKFINNKPETISLIFNLEDY